MIRSLIAALFGLLLAQAAAAAEPPPDPETGRRLAKQWCSPCHVVERGAAAAADVGPPFTALADDPTKSESALRGFLHHPAPPMPPISLTTQEIDHIVAYIRGLSETRASGDAAAGLAYAERHCARCHAVDRVAASPLGEAPAFRGLAAKWDPEVLAEALAEGIAVGHPDMPVFALDEQQIADFIAYLRVVADR